MNCGCCGECGIIACMKDESGKFDYEKRIADYRASTDQKALEWRAAVLEMDEKDFIQAYLSKNEVEDKYESQNAPCDFLQKNGNCILGECRPDSCKKYPYTNQPERMHSLLGVLNIITVCPVAYEIWERLKALYEFC